MPANGPRVLSSWANFYVMAGTSAAALVGLVFIVITLVTGSPRTRTRREGTATFSTPTIVHFATVLFVSAVLLAPWPSLTYPLAVLGIAGAFGVAYVLRVAYRMTRMEIYTADAEDYTWHIALPLLAYAVVFAGALALRAYTAPALFAIAAAVVAMLFIGIHNAWDVVTYLAIENVEEPADSQEHTTAPD